MNILWIDVETIGLNGPLMRIQYALDDGPIIFLDYPRFRGIDPLIVLLYDPSVLLVAYNASFDVFHLYRIIHELVSARRLDSKERTVPPFNCRVLDLQIPAMLHGPFRQFAFSKGKSRSVARVRRVPLVAVPTVRQTVLNRLRKHVPSEFDLLVGEHECKGQPDLRTLSFSVDGRASLKAHARFYGAETLSLPDFWPMVPRELEKPWLPYYEEEVYASYKKEAEDILQTPESPFHTYCRLDIWFMRLLAEKLHIETGRSIEGLVDHHSDCVHAVAYTRYHGFEIDREVLKRTEVHYEKKVRQAEEALRGIDLKSSKQRLELLRSVDPLVAASNRRVLENLATTDRPSARIAKDMLDFGKYHQRLLQVRKVLESRTGRAHPSLRIMGTATGRMAGSDGLNWQGIAQAERDEHGRAVGIRAAMKCGFGGDFDAMEVGIAAAAYNDQQLQEELDTGVDFHSMTASLIWNKPYEQIIEKKGVKGSEEAKQRRIGKTINFGIIYGAQKTKIAETASISETEAERFLRRFFDRYEGIGGYRERQTQAFCTADCDRWAKDSVRRMGAEVQDLLGFVRRFDFERAVATELWELGSEGICTGLVGSVTRTKEKGYQSIDNAVKSALLGSAIAIQAAVLRQACNSPVQSTGANLTKILMATIWNTLRIPVLNIHDELISPSELVPECTDLTNGFLSKYRQVVPSLNIEMKSIERWSEK